MKQTAQSINAFSVDLYQQLAPTPGNLILSPASVAFALGMTQSGASGRTATEIANTLHLADTSLPPDLWHASMGALATQWNELATQERLRWQPPIDLAIANRLFGDQATPFYAPFLEQIARDYRAPLQQLNFRTAADSARDTINAWVEEQTHRRIQDLVPPGGVDPMTRLVLVNAIYFKASWVHTFFPLDTTEQTFWANGTAEIQVPTMHSIDHASYAHIGDDRIQAIELPYHSGPFAMLVIVPDDRDGLASIERQLTSDRLERWIDRLSRQNVDLRLPKFKVVPSEAMPLAKPLARLGIQTAFGDNADFTKMAPIEEQLMVSEVFHKGFIAVDEYGTEAAAATAVVLAGSGAPTAKPIILAVDRPFLFLIRDTSTGAILFMGRILDPQSE